ncbi:vWA domain-containing protein [Alteromonas lipolytica]|uniref:IMP dehydrogenase n=1 Tax=Alteromonas lipolytica TaxID=1856405 RepID=A0A1E8FJ83_9ALTE|nr:VWA domain-containing protein [Alteromonas lipolytica]OFI35992.1 IMP dehydrogenase [Alteromonas lipolytica]GGF71860.1 VWR domain protein in aerotolerance operon BatA [Alteromonas lipolytica]
MFEFAWWWMLCILPLPWIIRLFSRRSQHAEVALRVPSLVKDLPDTTSPKASNLGLHLLAALVWICLVVAAARPQWLGEPVSIPSEGREMMLAVDLSGSMKIEDMLVNSRQVNRLTMIKSVLHDFIKRRVGDRLGLILFADTAYLQAPLTYDRETVATLLDESVIGLVGEQTAIGDAIGLAVKRFELKTDSNRVLILLTDGQNTAGNISPQQAKELAVDAGVTVYTIGVGADVMTVNSFFGSRQVNPSQELDETMLTDIAKATGGQYFRARDAAELEQIYAMLDQLQPIAGDERKMRPLTALYYYPLALALVVSLLPVIGLVLNLLWRRISVRRISAE